MPRKRKMTNAEAANALRRLMKNAIRFQETAYRDKCRDDPDHCMLISVIVPGKFGVGDEFFDAMRTLRRAKKRDLDKLAMT